MEALALGRTTSALQSALDNTGCGQRARKQEVRHQLQVAEDPGGPCSVGSGAAGRQGPGRAVDIEESPLLQVIMVLGTLHACPLLRAVMLLRTLHACCLPERGRWRNLPWPGNQETRDSGLVPPLTVWPEQAPLAMLQEVPRQRHKLWTGTGLTRRE